MNRLLIVTFVSCLFFSPAVAAPVWNVDHAKSRLGFSVQWSNQPFDAVFKSWKADIAFDPKDLGHSKAVVTINLASEDSGSEDNDDGLKGAEGFATDTFPTAKFETTGFTSKGGSNYVATGRLNLHGLTKPITLPFTLTVNGNTAHMVGKAVVSRIDFGLGQGEWAGDTPVGHAVTITVDLTATRAK
ncbi:MAG: YceI family protein [Alphaproteobacteria bacterium]|nr:YceI family protein [Alphaproteobacteria bacterium]MBV9419828.1 YceI family protein [Alphaproteobacteria bacterium]